MTKIGKKAAQDFLCAVSKVVDRIFFFIYSDYLLKNICQEDPNSHFSLYKTAENIFGKT
jgi:hypothetical protein